MSPYLFVVLTNPHMPLWFEPAVARGRSQARYRSNPNLGPVVIAADFYTERMVSFKFTFVFPVSFAHLNFMVDEHVIKTSAHFRPNTQAESARTHH